MSKTVPNARIGTPTPMTPVRAITSTISTRSTPSVPPATEAYEPLLKSLFQHRLKFVLLFTAAVTWLIDGFWAWWQLGSPKIWVIATLPLSPWIVFLALSWFTVALPTTVLRKVFLRAQRSGAASPIDIIKMSSSQKSMKVASIVYFLSALSALIIHTVMAYYYESDIRGDPKLSIFVKSKKHPYYLNGRLVFLFFSQASTALAFSLRGAMIDRFAYRWSHSSHSGHTVQFFTVAMAIIVSTVFSTMAISTASLLFAIARLCLPILIRIPLVSLLLRPFTAHFLKGQWSILLPLIHIPLLVRAWILAFTTLVTWEIADDLFEHVVSEPAHVSQVTADANTTIVSGISSSDRIFKYFAYSELRDLAKDQSTSASTQRTALFGDQQSSLNLWNFLVRESLALLESDYQLFLRRGQPAPPAPVPAPVTPKVTVSPNIATPTPLLRQRIFKSTPESPGQAALDALSSDGPIAKVVDVGADATHMPELFRSLETQVISSPIAAEAKKNVETAAGLGSRIKSRVVSSTTSLWSSYAPETVKDSVATVVAWAAKKRLSKEVEASLPFRELDLVVIEALSYLISSSLTEDRYGTVQRDIPKVLEIMVSFLSAVEEYQIKISTQQKPLSQPPVSRREKQQHESLAIEIHKSQEVLGSMGDGLKEGLARIVRTFGDKLFAFKFPPRIGHKLQEFLDYST
ncbi:Nucleoporin NDC1 [Psilocybe cubensis]|uniref:Nucleoporin NDC1 n=2 Tax=Psilocybe cubensis TaxID=181762 RepID=A0ACB8GLK9_PSICU|nr:Nucleoporin NDC1 [Psilocybe cubensis]KAH9476277.1 Nucleoporin NDC1 [Psilocybe cubensis]